MDEVDNLPPPYNPPDEEDDRDVALPQISRAPAQGSPIQWLTQVRKAVAKATTQALKALTKPDCAKLFGISDPTAVFSDLVQNDLTIGPIKSPTGTTISATTGGTTVVTANGTFNGAEIKINDIAGTFVTGSLNDQIVTLLHELGHAVNFYQRAGNLPNRR
jgi:hypothetical protein